MANVCSTRYFILSLVEGETDLYNVWDKDIKQVVLQTYASVPDFYELSPGSVIDAVQSGQFVFLVVKGTTSIVDNIFLQSTSGDYYNTLLSATRSGSTLTVVMYASTAREITTRVFEFQTQTNDSPPLDITPCFNDFELTDGSVIKQWCEGTTLKQVIYVQSPQGVEEVNTINSIACGYVTPPETNIRVTEIKGIDYVSCDFKNPVYLTWKNTLGGWDYWLFESNQTENIQTESIGSFTKDYTRIGDITNPDQEIGKTASKRITLYAVSLTTDQKIGLSQILYSNKIYIVNKDWTINREIKVLPGTFLLRETKNVLHEISFEILDAPINTITN